MRYGTDDGVDGDRIAEVLGEDERGDGWGETVADDLAHVDRLGSWPPVPVGATAIADGPRRPTSGRSSGQRLVLAVVVVAVLAVAATAAVRLRSSAQPPPSTNLALLDGDDDEMVMKDALKFALPPEQSPAAIAPGPGIGIDDGTWRVGADIQPGRYRANLAGNRWCAWKTGPDGNSDMAPGPVVADVRSTDETLTTHDCGAWEPVSAPVTTDGVPLANGVFIVGLDVRPGVYRAADSPLCQWARLRSFTGTTGAEIDWDSGALRRESTAHHPIEVEILPSDVGFSAEGCGPWTRVR